MLWFYSKPHPCHYLLVHAHAFVWDGLTHVDFRTFAFKRSFDADRFQLFGHSAIPYIVFCKLAYLA